MNTILSFAVEVALTLLIAALVVGYIRPFLKKVLVDLCGTEDRAQFWMAFANILLIGFPLILALAYQPVAENLESMVFEVLRKLGGNLSGMLIALLGVGFIVAFFAVVAPKPSKTESK